MASIVPDPFHGTVAYGPRMEILGLAFAGTATPQRAAMTAFAEQTLGLRRADAGTPYADMFTLPDGSGFAVSDEREEGGGTSRTVGLLVADVDAAVSELRAAGVHVDEPQHNERYRYAHFVAPDGELYEVVQEHQLPSEQTTFRSR